MLCSCIPVVTFLLVRYLDAVDSPELSIALWIHAFVCCLGALVILLQPCENGDKLRHATGSSWTAKLLRWLFWVTVLAVKWVVGLGAVSKGSAICGWMKLGSDVKINRLTFDQIRGNKIIDTHTQMERCGLYMHDCMIF